MRFSYFNLFLIPLFLFLGSFSALGQCENDTTLPSAICHENLSFRLIDGEVTVTPDLINEGSADFCTALENLDFRLETTETSNGNVPTSTAVTFQEAGTYTVVSWVIDEAGNVNSCWVDIQILDEAQNCLEDTEAPEVVCLNGLTTLQGGLIWAQDFILSTTDNCANAENLTYGLELVDDFTGTMPSNPAIEFNEPGIFNVYVWVADSQGNSSFCKTKIIISETIIVSGLVYNDANANCSLDSGESGLKKSVKISLFEDDVVYYSIVEKGSNGNYSTKIPKPQGTNARLEVSLVSESVATCQVDFIVDLSGDIGNNVTIPDIGVQLTQGCADLIVKTEVFSGECFESGPYAIEFQNEGDVETNPIITIEFANNVLIEHIFSTHPYVYTSDGEGSNSYTFEVKNLQPGEDGSIFIIGKQDCEVVNLTQVVTATITADNACSNNWTGPEINITKECLGDEVEFRIQNIGGGDMLTPSNFIVIEDVVMRTQNTFQLTAGEVETIRLPANGSTYHLTANQVETYPWQKITTVVSEGCAIDQTNITTGLVAQLPLENSTPHIDVAVKENKAVSYNRLDALPIGVGTQHLIAANTPIEYAIEYLNNGEKEVANQLSIEVDLAEELDINTLKVTYAKHTEYELIKKENNLVEFVFPHIALVHNSISAEEASGLIKFTIGQKIDVPTGTKIESKVTLAFNQDNRMTNSIFHTVGAVTSLSTAVTDILQEEIKLSVYPNPFHQNTTFKVINPTGETLDFELYNAKGQLMSYRQFNQSSFNLQRDDLRNGFYFYVIKHKGQQINRGKLIID